MSQSERGVPQERRGRPRDPGKYAAVLEAALHAFMERGFNAATIEDIAVRAGVSKVTVYSHFKDKESLFEAVVRARTEQIATETLADMPSAPDFEAQLNAFGCSLLGFLFDSNHVALDRMLPQEIAQIPALATRFFEAGPGQCRQRLTMLLAEGQEAGRIAFEDGPRAAEDLMALWKGFADVELKFGVRQRIPKADIEARVRHGTSVFLKAYRP